MRTKLAKREKGTVLVTTAVSMVALIAVLGLGIDMGVLYTARTSAQHAADAAALAGAYAYMVYPSASIVNPAYSGNIQNVATRMAQGAAVQNQILGSTLTTSDLTITFPLANRITVAVQKTVPTYFIKVLGWNNVTVHAQATAEAATAGSATTCLRPFWITKSTLLGGSCGNPVPNPGFNLVLWDKQSDSQWGLFGQSAASISNQITSCSGVLNACSDVLLDKPGASVGGVKSPVEQVICPDESGNCQTCPSDSHYSCGDWTWQGPGDYLKDGISGPNSPAVMTVAIWDDCAGPPPRNGRGSFPVAGYAQIFVSAVGDSSTKKIQAKFLQMNSCPSGNSSGGGSGATGPGAVPLRLINP